MTTLTFSRTTSATPEQFLAALTDFGPGRSEIFPNSADGFLSVHEQGDDFADVTEGSRGIWERLRYDWSDPNRIVLTTTDSNVWGGASGHTYMLTPQPDGGCRVDVTVVREGKGARGWLIERIVALGGKRVLGTALDQTIRAVESRPQGQ
jgi:polyketide cyclase/dehydrase/lipid transport protein